MSPKRCAELEAAAQAALDAADRTGEPQWVALQAEIAHCDALAAFAISEAEDRFYWERPVDARSIAAFGPTTPRDNTPQRTVLEPTTMYGVTKVAGELLCQYYFV